MEFKSEFLRLSDPFGPGPSSLRLFKILTGEFMHKY